MTMIYDTPKDLLGTEGTDLGSTGWSEITQERIDEAVRRILSAKFAAGLFDAPMPSVRAEPLLALVGSQPHREVARKAARKSLVLLKNNGGTLPISPTANVLIAGAGADSIEMQTGGWLIENIKGATCRAF